MGVASVRPKVVEPWFESRRRVWWEYVGVRVGLVWVIAAEDHGTAIPFLECSPRSFGACARWCCHRTLPYVFPPLPSHGAGEWGEGGVAAAIRSVASRVRPRFSSGTMKFYLGKNNVSACLTRKNLDGPFSGGGTHSEWAEKYMAVRSGRAVPFSVLGLLKYWPGRVRGLSQFGRTCVNASGRTCGRSRKLGTLPCEVK